MDHQAALASALAMSLALYHRDRTGEGQVAAGSLLGASILTVSETIVLDDGTLSPFRRLDARQLGVGPERRLYRSEEHTSELQSLMRISYAVFCLKKKKYRNRNHNDN